VFQVIITDNAKTFGILEIRNLIQGFVAQATAAKEGAIFKLILL